MLKLTGQWKDDRQGIHFSGYTNTETEKFLLIAANNKGDTLLTYLGKKERAFSGFYKLKGNYILEINNAYLNDKFQEVGSARPSGNAYFIDSLYSYKVDTTTQALKRIPRLADNEIIGMATKKYNLEGHFIMVHNPLNEWFTMAKDTLNGQQVYYKVKTDYQIMDLNDELKIAPVFEYIENKGFYNNGITTHEELVGCTNKEDSSNNRCIYSKFYYRFTQTLTFDNFEEIEKVEVVARIEGKSAEKILLALPKKDFPSLNTNYEINANGFVLTDVRCDLFEIGGHIS